MHFLTLSACGISSPGGASPRDCEERSDRRVQEGAGDVKLIHASGLRSPPALPLRWPALPGQEHLRGNVSRVEPYPRVVFTRAHFSAKVAGRHALSSVVKS